MLILTRRTHECVVIDGDNIKIEVINIKKDRVKIGVKAPPGLAINRVGDVTKPAFPLS